MLMVRKKNRILENLECVRAKKCPMSGLTAMAITRISMSYSVGRKNKSANAYTLSVIKA